MLLEIIQDVAGEYGKWFEICGGGWHQFGILIGVSLVIYTFLKIFKNDKAIQNTEAQT